VRSVKLSARLRVSSRKRESRDPLNDATRPSDILRRQRRRCGNGSSVPRVRANRRKELFARHNCAYQPLVGSRQTFNLRRAYVRLSTPDIARARARTRARESALRG